MGETSLVILCFQIHTANNSIRQFDQAFMALPWWGGKQRARISTISFVLLQIFLLRHKLLAFSLIKKNSKKVEIVKAYIIPTKAFLWNITFETQLKFSPLVQTMLASQNMKSTGRNKCSHDEVVLMNCRVPEIKISLR